MDAFDIDISAPVDTSGFTGGLGGPDQGDHMGPHWYNEYGMDIGASGGAAVYAAFDANITQFQPHVPSADISTWRLSKSSAGCLAGPIPA